MTNEEMTIVLNALTQASGLVMQLNSRENGRFGYVSANIPAYNQLEKTLDAAIEVLK